MIRRLAVSFAATAGLALASVVWSESWFWGRWRVEDSPVEFLTTVAFYAAAVQVVRYATSRWRVAESGRGAWMRVLLAGALYGWLVEGVLVSTVIDDIPLTLSYTGLAWHALFVVLLGWWWVPRRLAAPIWRSLGALALVGVGVGAWASFWRFEEGVQTPVAEYALFAVLTTAGYAAGLAIWWVFRAGAAPGIRGSAVAIAVLVGFAVIHAIENPLTLIGPALVGVALLAIITTSPRAVEGPLLATGGPRPFRSLWRLAVVPIVATAVFSFFALPSDPIPTGWLFLIVTAPLGVVLFVVAWIVAGRARRAPAGVRE